MLASIVEDKLEQYYHRSLSGLRVDQGVLDEYVREQLPLVDAHLRAHAFDLSFVSTNWLLCLLINSLPWDCVLHLMDVLLYDGPHILLRASVALLLLLQPRILACRSQVKAARQPHWYFALC